MSRTTVIILILILLILGGLFWLSTVDSEVAPTTIEQDVTNEALAQ